MLSVWVHLLHLELCVLRETDSQESMFMLKLEKSLHLY